MKLIKIFDCLNCRSKMGIFFGKSKKISKDKEEQK